MTWIILVVYFLRMNLLDNFGTFHLTDNLLYSVVNTIGFQILLYKNEEKGHLTTSSDRHGGQSESRFKTQIFGSSKQDPNAHSLWLPVRMFFFFFVYFSKRKLRLFYERMSTLPIIPIPQGKGGLTLCKTPCPALVSFPSWTPKSPLLPAADRKRLCKTSHERDRAGICINGVSQRIISSVLLQFIRPSKVDLLFYLW